MSATQLACSIREHPIILKPLLAACNLAGRALKRDLKIENIDTYEPNLNVTQANAIAGYVLSFLPPFVELPTLSRIDRISFTPMSKAVYGSKFPTQFSKRTNQASFSASHTNQTRSLRMTWNSFLCSANLEVIGSQQATNAN
jgi:hypothetical protein